MHGFLDFAHTTHSFYPTYYIATLIWKHFTGTSVMQATVAIVCSILQNEVFHGLHFVPDPKQDENGQYKDLQDLYKLNIMTQVDQVWKGNMMNYQRETINL